MQSRYMHHFNSGKPNIIEHLLSLLQVSLRLFFFFIMHILTYTIGYFCDNEGALVKSITLNVLLLSNSLLCSKGVQTLHLTLTLFYTYKYSFFSPSYSWTCEIVRQTHVCWLSVPMSLTGCFCVSLRSGSEGDGEDHARMLVRQRSCSPHRPAHQEDALSAQPAGGD